MIFLFLEPYPPTPLRWLLLLWLGFGLALCSHIRNSRFPLSQTLDSGKAQFSFISILNFVAVGVVVVVWTRIFLATSRMALFAKLKIAFQVASRRPMAKNKIKKKNI